MNYKCHRCGTPITKEKAEESLKGFENTRETRTFCDECYERTHNYTMPQRTKKMDAHKNMVRDIK